MRCISPIRIRNPSKYKFKQRWQPFIDVPCGKCLYCLQRRSNNFAFRIACELKCSKFNPLFVTLTYDEFNVPFGVPVISDDAYDAVDRIECFDIQRGSDRTNWRIGKYSISPDDGRSVLFRRDLTKFLKRFRVKFDVSIRYFACGEYGEPAGREVKRPHYHLIIWSLDDFIETDKLYRAITDSWSFGFVTISSVASAHVHYVAKYCCGKYFTDNPFNNYKDFRPFIACSKGLGKCFLTPAMKRYIYQNLGNFTYLPVNGEKFSLPRYIKDSLDLSIDQREKYLNSLLVYGLQRDLIEFNSSKSYESLGHFYMDRYSDFERQTLKKLQKRNL